MPNVSNRNVQAFLKMADAQAEFTESVKSQEGKKLLKTMAEYNDILKIAKTVEQADAYLVRKQTEADLYRESATEAVETFSRTSIEIAEKREAENTLQAEKIKHDRALIKRNKAAMDRREVEAQKQEERGLQKMNTLETWEKRLIAEKEDLEKKATALKIEAVAILDWRKRLSAAADL